MEVSIHEKLGASDSGRSAARVLPLREVRVMSRVACFLIALAIAPAAAADSTSVNAGKCAFLKAFAEKENGATTSAAEAEAQHVLALAPDYQLALNVMRKWLDAFERLPKRDGAANVIFHGARACEEVGIQWWRWH